MVSRRSQKHLISKNTIPRLTKVDVLSESMVKVVVPTWSNGKFVWSFLDDTSNDIFCQTPISSIVNG